MEDNNQRIYDDLEADYSDGTYFYYTYDAVGNRLEQLTATGTNTYTYDAANRLIGMGGTITYTWDANGNWLGDGTNTATYNHANRLATISAQQYLSVTVIMGEETG